MPAPHRRLLLLLGASAVCFAENSNYVLAPPTGRPASLPEKLLVMIPGANVATEHYLPPMKSLQEAATGLRLWVVIPAIPGKLCIPLCGTSSLCAPLHALVQSVVSEAVKQGYQGKLRDPDVFLAGHSLGGICAGNMAEGYLGTDSAYAALMLMGSYVQGFDVGSFPIPVLTLGAELDGGAARPAVTWKSLVSSDAAARSHGLAPGAPWQLDQKPVLILPGLDHSSFCPGFKGAHLGRSGRNGRISDATQRQAGVSCSP